MEYGVRPQAVSHIPTCASFLITINITTHLPQTQTPIPPLPFLFFLGTHLLQISLTCEFQILFLFCSSFFSGVISYGKII